MRLVPIAAADMMPLCRNLDDVHDSYLDRFSKSHFFSIVTNKWDPDAYSPLRERDESQRAEAARKWYAGVTDRPTAIGKRLARVFKEPGVEAAYEREIKSKFSSVKADVLVDAGLGEKRNKIVELKAYSPKNTMPSSIRDAIRTTLKRQAQLMGFVERQ